MILVHFTGEDVPLSPFCTTNVGAWDTFRHIDMDIEVFTSLIHHKMFIYPKIFTWWIKRVFENFFAI